MALNTFLVASLAAFQLTTSSPSVPATDCVRVQYLGFSGAALDVCSAEAQLNLAETLPVGNPDRRRLMAAAADLYRRAVDRIPELDVRAGLVARLADLYDAGHLNDPTQLEPVLRDLIALRPTDADPQYRLAALQEKRQRFEEAEGMLLAIRRQWPDEVEPYRRLAEFYARRVTELSRPTDQALTREREP